MDIFPVVPGMTLELGKTGTHYVRAFRFDISAWQEAYPDGIINLIHRLPDANEPYVAGYLRLGEGYIDWVVQSSDVAVPGYGECELVMIVDGVAVDKTDTYPTHIEEQLGTNSVTPPTGATWVEQVLTVGNATLQAVDGFEDLVAEKEQDITDLASGKEQNITDLAAQKIAAIEAKGAQTLDSIPEDYSELSDDVDELKRALSSNVAGKLEIQSGIFSALTGGAQANAQWSRTPTLPVHMIIDAYTTDLIMILLAYSQDGVYIGAWDGQNFVKNYDPSYSIGRIDADKLYKKFPSYLFKIDYQVRSGSDFSPAAVRNFLNVYYRESSLDSIEIEFVKGRRANGDIVSANSRCITKSTFDLQAGDRITINSLNGYRFALGSLEGYDSGMQTGTFSHVVTDNNKGEYYVVVAKSSDESISINEATQNINIELSDHESEEINNIHAIIGSNNITITWINGRYTIDNEYAYASTRCTFDEQVLLHAGQTIKIENTDGKEYAMAAWLLNGTNVLYTGWKNEPEAYKAESDCMFSLVVRNSDESAITPNQINITAYTFYENEGGIISRLEKVERAIQEVDYPKVPSYYVDHLNAQINKIKSNMDSVGRDGETFIFITDLHWERNYRNSPDLIKYILYNTNVRILLCGGDLINTQDKALAKELLFTSLKSFDMPGYYMPVAFGNHDANSLNWATAEGKEENQLSKNEVFSLTQKNTSFHNNYISNDAINFYFDRKDTKTRFIVLDTGEYGEYSSETIPDFCKLLNDTPSGYHIILMQHWIVTGTLESNAKSDSARKALSIIYAFNNRTTVEIDGVTYDFQSSNGRIDLFLGGHTHFDWAYEASGDDLNWSGVPVVMTNCDSYRDNVIVPGTTDEQCFDVVTINYTDRNVKFVRIGRGEDRSYNY